jgi:hypothetical protein
VKFFVKCGIGGCEGQCALINKQRMLLNQRREKMGKAMTVIDQVVQSGTIFYMCLPQFMSKTIIANSGKNLLQPK